MRRFLLRWFAALLVLSSFCLPVAWAQSTPPGDPAKTAEGGEQVPAVQYGVAAILTIIVLIVVCTPSRRRG
jgi:hypothetical protein